MTCPKPNISPAEFDQIANDTAAWLPIIANIATKTSSSQHLSQFSEGANIVFAASTDRVIKLFPLFLDFQFKAEVKALSMVHSRVGTSTPKLIASGYHEGWPYLVMARLGGLPLSQKWTSFKTHVKKNLLFRVGEIIVAHHKIRVDQNSFPGPQWNHFIETQSLACVRRHTKLNLPIHYINEIAGYLDKNLGAIPLILTNAVLLTGEYTPGNLLIEHVDEQWKISGLIDYGDAMVGYHEYDFLGPATFLAGGNKELLESLLSGYGYKPEEINGDLAKRMMTLLLLHRYSNFEVQIQIPDWKKLSSLSELQKLIFPLD